MIEYKKAQKILLNSKIKIQNELIFAKNSLNRVSAKNIFSPTNYPAGNNTAFDGYAVNSKETVGLSNRNKRKFKIKHSFLKTRSKIFRMDKIFLGIIVNIFITAFSYSFTSFLLDLNFNAIVFFIILFPRIVLPFIFF